MRRGVCIVLLFLQVCGVCAQQQRLMSRERLDSLMSPALVADADKMLRFDTLLQDMGVIYEDASPRVVEFAFTNVCDDTLYVTRITTNCGCTAPLLSDSVLSPGEKGTVSITFSPRGRSGTVDTNAFVYTSLSATSPVAKLTLLGNVIDNNEWTHLPFSAGPLKLKRKTVVFEPICVGSTPQQRIPCANTGNRPLRLTSQLLPAFATFSTEPAEIAPGEEGDIVITIDADKLPSVAPEHFKVVIEGVGARIFDRTINVTIEK